MSQRSSTREKKLSQRASDAQDAGQTVPGIISPGSAIPSSSPARSRPTPLPSVTTAMSGAVYSKPAPLPTIPPARSTSAHSQFTPRPSLTTTMSRPARSRPGTAEDYGLGPDKFLITMERRAHDIDVGQDDWNDFDNFLSSRGIASAFMQRAKRAFWAGTAWKDFEQEERSIIPVTLNAKGEQIDDPYVLDNGRRMEIFEAIKVRLRKEIWREKFPAEPSTQAASSAGNVRHDTPGPGAEEREPSKEQRAEGIIKVTKNREGDWEPWYHQDAVINPSGIAKGMQASREEPASSQPDLVRDMEDSD